MEKQRVEREVQNAVESLNRDYLYIGQTTTVSTELLIMNYEFGSEPLSFRIIDDGSSLSLTIESGTKGLLDLVSEDAENIELYINRVFYFV
ncbi:hypothetical protein ACEN2P_03190 [Pedobacter psychrotolerans]|uniref:hypothetical protein n=1 Tax=Pedobacter psychrotolerans TaxID=1843235 RepID=UPI003F976849